jgi:glycosyltransferase involved in cell wall biosynthesis
MGQDVKPPNKYLKLLKNNKTKFIALSKNQADEFNRWAKRKADKIIHWGINDQQILLTERDIDLLAVGSLIPLKNYSLFIQLAEEAVKIFPDLKCVIAGSGPELQK